MMIRDLDELYEPRIWSITRWTSSVPIRGKSCRIVDNVVAGRPEYQVVEPDDADVVGHRAARAAQRREDARSDRVRRREDAVEFAAVVQVEKTRVGMKPLQRRILVVGVNRDVRDTFVLEELDEIHSEEALADAAFAIQDQIESFHVV